MMLKVIGLVLGLSLSAASHADNQVCYPMTPESWSDETGPRIDHPAYSNIYHCDEAATADRFDIAFQTLIPIAKAKALNKEVGSRFVVRYEYADFAIQTTVVKRWVKGGQTCSGLRMNLWQYGLQVDRIYTKICQ